MRLMTSLSDRSGSGAMNTPNSPCCARSRPAAESLKARRSAKNGADAAGLGVAGELRAQAIDAISAMPRNKAADNTRLAVIRKGEGELSYTDVHRDGRTNLR